MRHARFPAALAAFTLALLVGSPADGGTPERAANLLGHVLDSQTGEPVTNAAVTLETTSTTRFTSPLGSFSFTDVPLGVHYLRIEALGFGDIRVQLRLQEDKSYETEFFMGADPVEIEGLEVRVIPRRTFNELRDLDLRLERGTGQFILREEMRRRGGTLVDLLRGQRGVRIGGGGGTTSGRTVQLRRAAHITSTAPGVNVVQDCFPAVFVDGNRFSRRASLGDQPTDLTEFLAFDLQAVEVYSGSSVPAVYGGGDAACGAILIWTRRGPVRRVPGNTG